MDRFEPLRVYSGEALEEISMPVGGIGGGFFGFGGRGQLGDVQLMNRPNRGWKPLYMHLMLRTDDGSNRRLRVLEGQLKRGKAGDWGHPEVFASVTRFPKCRFDAAFPFGRAVLEEPGHVSVELEAFSPFIPGESDDSGLPMGLLTVSIRNDGPQPVDASLCWVETNVIGCDGITYDLKDNVTEFAQAAGWKGMRWHKQRDEKNHRMGTVGIFCDASDVTVARRWAFRDRPWNGERLGLMDALLEKGVVEDPDPSEPCPPSPDDTWDGSLTARVRLAPGETKHVRFLMTWLFPWIDAKVAGWEWRGAQPPLIRTHLSTRFEDAVGVAEHVIPRLDQLRARSLDFVQSVLKKNAPDAIKEAALFNLAHLKSHTVMRIEDGTLMGFEGCNATTGCCMGSCTHVWNYEESLVDLFPDLHRSMLEAHLKAGLTASGGERFRIVLPLIQDTENTGGAAADGQMGLIVRIWEQYAKRGDRAWLLEKYPQARKLLEFAWLPGGWDADKDGVMEGCQHNTYDVEFFGPNPMCTVYYLAAIKAVSEMAKLAGDDEYAEQLSAMAKSGATWIDQNLYNGEYYEQRIEPMAGKPVVPMTSLTGVSDRKDPPHQLGSGCLIDQLVGQYKAHRAGLGAVVDGYHALNTLRSIYKYNYKPSLADHVNNMRTYATPDEGGTVICTYPRGGRPEAPIPYWGECMTGFEHQLGVILLDYGLKDEAVAVIKAIRDRHTGDNRNPFNEPECGSFYARSMAAWALLDAWDRAGHALSS